MVSSMHNILGCEFSLAKVDIYSFFFCIGVCRNPTIDISMSFDFYVQTHIFPRSVDNEKICLTVYFFSEHLSNTLQLLRLLILVGMNTLLLKIIITIEYGETRGQSQCNSGDSYKCYFLHYFIASYIPSARRF